MWENFYKSQQGYYPRDPSTQIIPTLGPKVFKYYLHWAIWIPRGRAKVCISDHMCEHGNTTSEPPCYWQTSNLSKIFQKIHGRIKRTVAHVVCFWLLLVVVASIGTSNRSVLHKYLGFFSPEGPSTRLQVAKATQIIVLGTLNLI